MKARRGVISLQLHAMIMQIRAVILEWWCEYGVDLLSERYSMSAQTKFNKMCLFNADSKDKDIQEVPKSSSGFFISQSLTDFNQCT